jgi:hypothetical protein
MQKMRCFIMLSLLLCKAGFALAQYDSIVKANNVKYQQVRNKLDEYEAVKSVIAQQGENIQRTAYYKGNELEIIEIIYLHESGHRQIEYYFENGNLYFALVRDQTPEETTTLSINGKKNNNAGANASKPHVMENRYYIHEDKLIRWYDNDHKQVDLSIGTNSTAADSLIIEAYKLKEQMKK